MVHVAPAYGPLYSKTALTTWRTGNSVTPDPFTHRRWRGLSVGDLVRLGLCQEQDLFSPLPGLGIGYVPGFPSP